MPEVNGRCLFQSLLIQFNETSRNEELEHIKTDFQFIKEGGIYPGRVVNYITDSEEMSNSKDKQADNIEAILDRMDNDEVCSDFFTLFLARAQFQIYESSN